MSLLMAVLVQAGCAAHDGDPPASSTVQAIAADWIHPACEASALSPPNSDPQRCNGPWLYSYQEFWNNRAVCEDSTICQTNKTCTSWDLNAVGDGLGFSIHDQSDSTTLTNVCPGGRPQRACTKPPNVGCQNAASSFSASIHLARPGASTQAFANFSVSFTSTTLNVEVDPEPPQTGGPHTTTTTYRCDLVAHNVPDELTNIPANARPACGCAVFVPKECKRGPETFVFSAPGALKPSSPGAPASGSTRREFVHPRECTTCDVASIADPTSAQAAFTCLDKSLDNASGLAGLPGLNVATVSDLIASVAGRMELLLQLVGDKLPLDQQQRGLEIYTEAPTGMPACRQPVAFSPDCQIEARAFQLPGQLQMCSDVAVNPNTPRAVAQLELAQCLTSLATVNQLTTDGCRLATRDAADLATRGVMSRAQPDYSTDLGVALPIVMSQVNTWWAAASVAARGDTRWLTDRVSKLTANFWSSLEAAKVPLPATTADDQTAVALLAKITGIERDNDIAVISALFDSSQTTSSPVLLTLTGDALRGIEDRIAHLETIHDVGCRFAKCKTPTSLRQSALSELVHVLSVLPDATKLGPALSTATELQAQQAALHGALSKLAAQHSRLEAAWSSLGRTEPFSTLAQVANPPAEAAALAKLVSEATLAWASYAATGEFLPAHRPRLTAATLEQGDVVHSLDRLISDAATAKATYTSQLHSTVNDLLSQIHNNATQQSVVDRNALLAVQLKNVVARSLGLEGREASDRAHLAKFQQAFELVAPALDPNAVFQATTLETLHPSAADTHHALNATTNLTADRFHVETLNRGEALRFHIDGTWSPVCAVSQALLANPHTGSATHITVPSPALTGPTGYFATFDTNSYRAHIESSTFDVRSDIGISIEACTGTPGSEMTGASLKACVHANYDRIQDESTSSQSGIQSRTDASFVSGIRLPSTPYPVAPAGSLVVVTTRAGDPTHVIGIHVVQTDDVIFAPTLLPGEGNAVDLHLVVNDGTNSGCTVDAFNHLDVSMTKTVSVGSSAQALGAAMAATLNAIEAHAPAILAEGQLSADESTALRSGAWTRLQQNLPSGTSIAGLPADLHQLFEAFLDEEIASIGRRGQMHAAALQREQLLLELATNIDELDFADQQSRLLFLVPRWRLRDLSGVDLAQSTEALTQSLTSYVAPIFELRDPGHSTEFSSDVVAQLSGLIDMNITALLEDHVANLIAFATTTRNKIDAAKFELPDKFRRDIVIAIPRPPTAAVPDPVAPPWNTVSAATAKAFWSSVFDASGHLSHAAVITLSPSDLYVFGGDSATLACSDVAPVIRRAAIYLDTLSSPSNQLGIELGSRAAGIHNVSFPLVGRVESLEPDDARGIPLSLPVLAGEAREVLDKFSPAGASDPGLGAGAGLSPFTSFEIDMSSMGAANAQEVWNNTQALYLVFHVERQVSLDPPDVEGVCVLPTP